MNIWRGIALIVGGCLIGGIQAQSVRLTPEQYEQMKLAGTLPSAYTITWPMQKPGKTVVHPAGTPKGGGVPSDCNCWIQPDVDYTLAMGPNDDFSSSQLTLPFNFNLYGSSYTNFYINNNGNISFDAPWSTFTATGFPNGSFVMVAPFWSDIDTRGDDGLGLNGGTVKYKMTPTALYVNWDDCGYFNEHTDKKVFIQLIITDGTDPILGVGNNVSFCYKEMDWTTGDASSGVNGFGGSPAVVGANRGNGVDFIQFGTFDQPGGAYDGPFGANDGIDWLDFKHFVFSTVTSSANVAPIASGALLCDTLRICTGETVPLELSFLAPESGQIINATSSCTTLSNYTELANTSGNNTATITSTFTPTTSEVGYHTIDYTATDNGVPPLTTTVHIVVEVTLAPSGPPVVSGDLDICAGTLTTLTASGGPFDQLIWSTGATTPDVQVPGGSYSVTGLIGGCSLSTPVIVNEQPNPQPVITGILFNCGGDPAVLSTTQPYTNYSWSNGSSAPTVTVGTGTYSVAVTDANGCTGTSAYVNVVSAPSPSAFFNATPPSPQQPGVQATFNDASTGNGGTVNNWSWTLSPNGGQGSGNSFQTVITEPGEYTMCLTVTTTDGCTDTYCGPYVVAPAEIFIPNVFSPNGDNLNDLLEFTNLQYYSNSHLIVYSRWGNVVYENFNYRNTWNGKDVSDGTYFFVLELADGRKYSGHVTLLR